MYSLFKVVRGGGADVEAHCPRCHEGYLHQIGYSIYTRTREDAATKKIMVADTTVSFCPGDASAENPSRRRDALAVWFRCETCPQDDLIELTISQHKGVTYFAWRDHHPKDDFESPPTPAEHNMKDLTPLLAAWAVPPDQKDQ